MLGNNKNRFMKGLYAFVALILVMSLISGCGKKADTKNSSKSSAVVATYKGGNVTQAELDSFIGVVSFMNPQYASFKEDPQFLESVLSQLVVGKVLVSRASEKSKKDAEEAVKKQMDEAKKLPKDQKDDLDKRLAEQKITLTDVENYIRTNQIVMNEADSKVTDQQIKDLFDSNLKEDPNAYDIATVSHILIALKDPTDASGQKELRTKDEALKRANEVKNKLKAGGDFAALAKEYSDDSGSKDNGGKYEDQPISQWVPEFKKAAATLALNTISDPVETQFGYHVMKVESRSTKKLEDVKDSLRSELAQKQISDFMQNEFPSLEFKSNLPSPSPSASPAASPVASPAASPAATNK